MQLHTDWELVRNIKVSEHTVELRKAYSECFPFTLLTDLLTVVLQVCDTFDKLAGDISHLSYTALQTHSKLKMERNLTVCHFGGVNTVHPKATIFKILNDANNLR